MVNAPIGCMVTHEFFEADFRNSISVFFSVTGNVLGCKPIEVKPDLEATYSVFEILPLSS